VSAHRFTLGLMYGIGIGMFANHVLGWLEAIVMHAKPKKRAA
jgi:hypothetical protein